MGDSYRGSRVYRDRDSDDSDDRRSRVSAPRAPLDFLDDRRSPANAPRSEYEPTMAAQPHSSYYERDVERDVRRDPDRSR